MVTYLIKTFCFLVLISRDSIEYIQKTHRSHKKNDIIFTTATKLFKLLPKTINVIANLTF